jgi:hypothetical protein
MFTYTKLAMATLECKLAMHISRLVEFELLFGLKFEEKNGTSLHTSRYKATSSSKQSYGLSVPVIYFDIRPYNERDLAIQQYLCTQDLILYNRYNIPEWPTYSR